MKNEPTHLDLFSGLGGFALASRQAGFKTLAFCESDERCRRFLSETWGAPIEQDIRLFDATRYRGVSLLTGGPPCQPSSRAGQQRGEDDDRWLWDEVIRVLAEARPYGFIFETPTGILDLDFDGILIALERCGYEVQPFDIPACAVGSPQIRQRLWIIGFMADTVCNGRDQAKPGDVGSTTPARSSYRDNAHGRNRGLADAASSGHQRRDAEKAHDGRTAERGTIGVADPERERRLGRSAAPGPEEAWQERPEALYTVSRLHWDNYVWVPCEDDKLRRAPDESVPLVNGLHSSVLAALGNSIVPQVAYEIISRMKEYL